MVVIADKPKQKAVSVRKRPAKRKFNYEYERRAGKFQLLIQLPFSLLKSGSVIHRFSNADDNVDHQSDVVRKLFEITEIYSIDIETDNFMAVLYKRSKALWNDDLMNRVEDVLAPFIEKHNEAD